MSMDNDKIRANLAKAIHDRFEEDRDDVPTAYGNCQCSCHRYPGVMHVMACCHPEDDKELELQLKKRMEALDELAKQAQELNMGYGEDIKNQ